MHWFKRSSQFRILAGLLALVLAIVVSPMVHAQPQPTSISSQIPNTWTASFEPPPGSGNPGNRQGGATRGPCVKNKHLYALVPPSGMGATVTPYPTLFWYLPETEASSMEFKLWDENDKQLYSTKWALAPGQSGFMNLRLPTDASLFPLEIGQQYHWELMLLCGEAQIGEDQIDEKQIGKQITVSGSIKRVEKAAALANQIKQANPQERVAIYAKAGFWYETVAALFDLRRLYPNDRDLTEAWTKLLKSVELNEIAEEPLVANAVSPSS